MLPGVSGEGLLLEPRAKPKACVVAIPDAAQTPEMLVGLAAGLPPEAHFARHMAQARGRGRDGLAPQPDAGSIETIIDAAFWASLRREEGYTPTISLAFLPPERAVRPTWPLSRGQS